MVYLDSNVFLYPVIYEEQNPRARKAREILLQVAKREKEGFTAALTWDEVVWVTRRLLGEKDAIEQGRKLLTFPNLNFVTIDSAVLMIAQRVMEDHGLKPRDALHAGAALVAGQRTIVSDDSDFDNVKGLARTAIRK